MPRTMSDHILSHGGDLPSGMTTIRPTARRRQSTQREREREREKAENKEMENKKSEASEKHNKERERKPFWDNKSLF